MDFGILEALLSLMLSGVMCVWFFVYTSKSYEYWKKRGVEGPEPSLPFGNWSDVILRRKAVCHKLEEIYAFGDTLSMIGYYVGSQPVLMIKDPDLIRTILIKDFNVFDGRGISINESVDPLSAHLFNIDGQRWRFLRQKLSPVFTSGKLRNMFGLMAECADTFERHLAAQVANNKVVECREIAARYTTDVIGSCAFGIDTQALRREDSIFRRYGRMIFEPSLFVELKNLLRQVSPRFYAFLRLSTVKPEITRFFIDTMRRTVALRKHQRVKRNDFVDLLMQIPKEIDADGSEWSDTTLTAQAFVFFGAGFETSSTTISFALWELSRVPEVQETLRSEILKFDRENDGCVSYESVNDMRYLDMVVKETLRKNPPAIVLVRRSTEDYTIPGTGVTLPAGQRVQIPAYSLHRDPKYYPRPEVFDPERFNDGAKQSRHPMVFLPFGDGPKNCIGMRFAYYQVKLALIKIFKNFRVKSTSGAPYVVNKNAIVLSPVGGIVLEFEPLEA